MTDKQYAQLLTFLADNPKTWCGWPTWRSLDRAEAQQRQLRLLKVGQHVNLIDIQIVDGIIAQLRTLNRAGYVKRVQEVGTVGVSTTYHQDRPLL